MPVFENSVILKPTGTRFEGKCMANKYTLIGIDGGASKVSGWAVEHDASNDTFSLGSAHSELSYSTIDGFIPDFRPVILAVQLKEFQAGTIAPTADEIQQGETYIEASARVIISLAKETGNNPLLIGLGMPGLKTADKRGIAVVANGPRMINYAAELEGKLLRAGIDLLAPIAHIGSDADYCGIGEKYAQNGSFRGVNNAYYLGGGTGAADALLLDGNLIPFDLTKPWLAKTWEMKNEQDLSLERYASASGIQHIYSVKSGIAVEELNRKKIFPPQIANFAMEGDEAARSCVEDVAQNLAMLFYERITTLFAGSANIFKFVNSSRPLLESDHPWINSLFDHIAIGQRLGDLLNSRAGNLILTLPLIARLAKLIDTSEQLPEEAKAHYLHGNKLRNERIVFSPLREAPALGAGIDAFLVYKSQTE